MILACPKVASAPFRSSTRGVTHTATHVHATDKRGKWVFTYLGTGGRESQTAKKSDGSIAWTNLDADGLRVELLPS